MLLKRTKGVLGQGWGPLKGNMGALGYMGEAWDPQESLKVKNHQGSLEWGTEAGTLGISPSAITPPGGPGAAPRQMACDCAGSVSIQRQKTWTPKL